jgi:sugar phosphate isomerase/epimerase
MAEPFKLCILFGDAPDRPIDQIAPGFDISEVPLGLLCKPFDSHARWAKAKVQIQSWKLPPIKVASHFLHDFGLVATGPDADFEQVEFWAKRAFPRLSELGVEVAGIYGRTCMVPEGFSRTKATDQAIRFAHLLADQAGKYNIQVALEPTADADTLWPRYLDGIAFAKEVKRPNIKVMADLAYFLKLNQPFEDILKEPEYCLHAHVQGEGGQPGVGNKSEIHKHFFEVLKKANYTRGVSCACPWVSSTPGQPMNFATETAKTLKYLKDLRAKVYGG